MTMSTPTPSAPTGVPPVPESAPIRTRKAASPVASLPGRGFSDSLAVVVGVSLLALGAFQLFGPGLVVGITGVGSDTGATMIGGQWLLFGLLMLVGGITRIRAIAMFGSEALFLISVVGCAVLAVKGMPAIPFGLQAIIGIAAFIVSGFARFIERSETKTLLAIARDARDR